MQQVVNFFSGGPLCCGPSAGRVEFDWKLPGKKTLVKHKLLDGFRRRMTSQLYTILRRSIVMNKSYVIACVMGLTLACSSQHALSEMIVTFAGSDLTVGEYLRTTTVAKPLDPDGDNVYGSDGYVFFNTTPHASGGGGGESPLNNARISLPSYVIDPISCASGTESAHGYGYLMIDDPDATPGSSVSNIESGLLGKGGGNAGTEVELFTITLTGSIPSAGFRFGVFTDNYDNVILAQQSLRVLGADGSGTSTASATVTSTDLSGDMYFFDITGGTSGDTVTLYATQSTDVLTTIGGITFETIPEPSTFVLLGMALLFGGILVWCRRRRN